MVELPDNCQIAPPRLGTVGEMGLDFRCVRKLGIAHGENDEGDASDDATERPTEPHQNAAVQTVEEDNVRIVGLLSSLRKAVWVVIALLVFLLIK